MPAVPGTPCYGPPSTDGDAAVAVQQESAFTTYLQLQHVRRAEEGRAQRWKCSWLYLLRACDSADAIVTTAKEGGRDRCRRVLPPDHSGTLGWRGVDPSNLTDIGPLLFSLRCW